ncbi:hypothetical protein F183_A26610 [Bryobacterales bacterium F-183]|nr:hypothetical protein F183_A26610 [Bryobacterales bacterium F-183]
MIYLVALLSALFGGAALGFGVGYGAAELFTRLGGSREGANAMGGFFFIGPFGLIAGALATFGAVVRYGGGSPAIAKWSLIGGGVVAALGSFLVLFLVASHTSSGSGGADFVLEYEWEFPPNIDPMRPPVTYGYHGHGDEAFPTWTFYSVRKSDSGANIAGSSMSMLDYPPKRTALLSLDGKNLLRFDIPVPGRVDQAVDWTDWQEGEGGVRFRWRMRKAN